MLRIRPLYLLLLAVALSLQAPLFAQREKFTPEDLVIVKSKWPEAKRTITGLRYVMLAEGTGDTARSGDMVSVVYRGSLINGTVFNEYLDKTKPFSFRLGRGQVVDGWDQGLKLMREGSKMTLIVPYELGYGTRGNPPAVPRETSLVFEIEMVKIERGSQPPPPPPEIKKKPWYRFN